jgi:hypothetical protein
MSKAEDQFIDAFKKALLAAAKKQPRHERDKATDELMAAHDALSDERCLPRVSDVLLEREMGKS